MKMGSSWTANCVGGLTCLVLGLVGSTTVHGHGQACGKQSGQPVSNRIWSGAQQSVRQAMWTRSQRCGKWSENWLRLDNHGAMQSGHDWDNTCGCGYVQSPNGSDLHIGWTSVGGDRWLEIGEGSGVPYLRCTLPSDSSDVSDKGLGSAQGKAPLSQRSALVIFDPGWQQPTLAVTSSGKGSLVAGLGRRWYDELSPSAVEAKVRDGKWMLWLGFQPQNSSKAPVWWLLFNSKQQGFMAAFNGL